MIIIGTGSAGVPGVPKKLISHVAAQHIELNIEKTPAVALFNSLLGQKHYVIAALHVTC